MRYPYLVRPRAALGDDPVASVFHFARCPSDAAARAALKMTAGRLYATMQVLPLAQGREVSWASNGADYVVSMEKHVAHVRRAP